MLQKIIDLENNFPKAFLDNKEMEFGIMFYDKENPTSYDSNHAIIYDFSNLQHALKTIKEFYLDNKLVPRIYSSRLDNEPENLFKRLNEAGFIIENKDHDKFFVKKTDCKITAADRLTFRRLRDIPTGFIDSIYDEDSYNEQGLQFERCKKYFSKALKCPNYHLIAGFLGNIPVTAASIQINNNGYARIDSVETGTAFRRNGYANELVRYLCTYFDSIGGEVLYLYSSVPEAIKIYNQAGFEQIAVINGWSACF